MTTIEFSEPRMVQGHMYRDVHEVHDDFEVYLGEEVRTIRCGFQPVHICTRACDCDCKLAQELFDEIGIDY